MPSYNIYKIDKTLEAKMWDKLKSVGLIITFDGQLNGARCIFGVSPEPHTNPIWWAEVYKPYIRQDLYDELINSQYFGVFSISTDLYCYAISLGKSHFYLKSFCQLDFGVEIGTRILSEHSIDQKSSRLFGGQRHKAITSFHRNSSIQVESGEAVEYLKGDTISTHWGSKVRCGNSAKFSLDLKPADLPAFAESIERELEKQPLFDIPRSTLVTDPEIIQILDTKLVSSIRQRESAFMMEEQALSGVEFLFFPDYDLKLKGRHRWLPLEPGISLDELNETIDQSGLVFSPDNLDNVKIRASSDSKPHFTKDIRHFVDFMDDELHYIEDGRWRRFNQVYVDFLRDSVDRIPASENPDLLFDQGLYDEFIASLPEKDRSHWYKERFFNERQMANLGYKCLDRERVKYDIYNLEIADMYKDGVLYFVKIGTPQKLGYVFDQSIAALKYLVENQRNLPLIGGTTTEPHTLCVVLFLDRASLIKRLSEVRSLIMLMKAEEWRKQVENARFTACIALRHMN